MTTITVSVTAESGQHIVADCYRIYPARWAEAHGKVGSLADHFSVTVQRVGNAWVIPRGPRRYCTSAGQFVAQQIFDPSTYFRTLDEALRVAVRIVEETANMHDETFSTVAAHILDAPEPLQ